MENMIRVIGNIELLKASDCVIYNTTKYLSPPEVYVHDPIIITGDNLIMDEEKSNTSDDDNDNNGLLYYEFQVLNEGEPVEKILVVFHDTHKNEFTGWCLEE
ncbi:hypothetical protein I5M27_10755 [Adhaeribacter sp. BT258]|uniref:Uncharacterized protein n=1 Tax=Adhaeribacter terrigena TaxID=2793070 RepID=A0ABS1C248_9BACT|nr:hypothetical protein [Adhaeribacter terrigena]MBK0403466.1 hypothetical protein [Adhaeribacter terrigena]